MKAIFFINILTIIVLVLYNIWIYQNEFINGDDLVGCEYKDGVFKIHRADK